MLKNSITTNTWACDCCGAISETAANPFLHLSLSQPNTPSNVSLEIDICQACIKLVAVQPVVDYVSSTVFP
jgi:hypothetical protein